MNKIMRIHQLTNQYIYFYYLYTCLKIGGGGNRIELVNLLNLVMLDFPKTYFIVPTDQLGVHS